MSQFEFEGQAYEASVAKENEDGSRLIDVSCKDKSAVTTDFIVFRGEYPEWFATRDFIADPENEEWNDDFSVKLATSSLSILLGRELSVLEAASFTHAASLSLLDEMNRFEFHF